MSRIPFLVEPVDVLYFGPPAAASAAAILRVMSSSPISHPPAGFAGSLETTATPERKAFAQKKRAGTRPALSVQIRKDQNLNFTPKSP